MNFKIFFFACALTVAFTTPAFAEETAAAETQEDTAVTDDKAGPNDQVIAERLAKSSGKTTEEILKMRNEEKMGWGNIAKELGVHPKELGQAIRDSRHERRDERKEARKERLEKRKDKREARKENRKDKIKK